jgi:hypothetical protein
MDSGSVMGYWELDQTLHSINTMRECAVQVNTGDTTSKGMSHHSPIR